MRRLDEKSGRGKRENDFGEAKVSDGGGMVSRLSIIQMLIPLGLKAVEEVLREEAAGLAGARYSGGDKLRKAVREEFGWDGVIRKYLDLYRSLGVTCET